MKKCEIAESGVVTPASSLPDAKQNEKEALEEKQLCLDNEDDLEVENKYEKDVEHDKKNGSTSPDAVCDNAPAADQSGKDESLMAIGECSKKGKYEREVLHRNEEIAVEKEGCNQEAKEEVTNDLSDDIEEDNTPSADKLRSTTIPEVGSTCGNEGEEKATQGAGVTSHSKKKSEGLANSFQFQELTSSHVVTKRNKERTLKAIVDGNAIFVECVYCQRWMQVTKDADVMLCPNCDTVGPVQRQTIVSTREEAKQLNMDRTMAERMQSEAYTEEGSSPIRDRQRARKSWKELYKRATAGVQNRKQGEKKIKDGKKGEDGKQIPPQEATPAEIPGTGKSGAVFALPVAFGKDHDKAENEEEKREEESTSFDGAGAYYSESGTVEYHLKDENIASEKEIPEEEKLLLEGGRENNKDMNEPPDSVARWRDESYEKSERLARALQEQEYYSAASSTVPPSSAPLLDETYEKSERLARRLQEQEYSTAASVPPSPKPRTPTSISPVVPVIEENKPSDSDHAPNNDPGSPDVITETASLDVALTLQSVRNQRFIQEGLCPTCGRRLFEIKKQNGGPLFLRKENVKTVRIPLTIEGEVLRGQCIHCTRQDEEVQETRDVMLSRRANDTSPDSQKCMFRGHYDEFGKKQGKGEIRWPNGDIFEGYFLKGMRTGEGKLTLADGSGYTGWWEADKMHGHGTRRFPSGNIYVGNYSEGLRNGQGTMYFANGDMYVGNWVNDVMNGPGKYTYNNANSFEGVFRDGKREGKGKYQYKDGRVDICKFERDDKVGEGVRWNLNRSRARRLVDGKLKGKISRKKGKIIEEQCGA